MTGGNPYGLVFSSDGNFLYEANWGTNSVNVIDVATNSVVDEISIGSYPVGISITPDGSKLFVVNYGSGTVNVISAVTNTVIDTITVDGGPTALGNFISIYPEHAGYASPCIVSSNISIYPNPANNNLTIETPQTSKIEISTIHGQLIKTLASTGTKTNIDVSEFPSGVYIVEVKTGKRIAIKKFVKE